MRVTTAEFQNKLLSFMNSIPLKKEDVIILRDGKPFAKLIYLVNQKPKPFLGSFMGVGHTTGDLLEPVETEWESA